MRIPLTAALVASAFLGACTGSPMSPAQPDTVSVPVRLQSEPRTGSSQALVADPAQLANNPDRLHTHLDGAEEVPARDTTAQGQATFKVNEDGTAIEYKLNVANIENVTQAHIHLGAAGSNGGIVVWLYPSAPPSQLIEGRTQGTLGEGEITASSLVNALSGMPLSALLERLRN